MEVHFNPELQAKLDRVAAENSSEADQYVQQLVEHYLDHDEWFRQKVKASLERLDRGEFLSHEEMGPGSRRSSARKCRFAGHPKRGFRRVTRCLLRVQFLFRGFGENAP